MRLRNILTASFLMCLVPFASRRAEAQPRQTLNEITADVIRLLQSVDAKEVAWGAFTAPNGYQSWES